MKISKVKIVTYILIIFAVTYFINNMSVHMSNEFAVNQLQNDNFNYQSMTAFQSIKNNYWIGLVVLGGLMFAKDIKKIIITLKKKGEQNEEI